MQVLHGRIVDDGGLVLAVLVQTLQLLGDLFGLVLVRRRQQRHRDVGVGKPPHRVESRSELKTDVLVVDQGLLDPGHVDELQQPRPPGPPQHLEPALQQVARVRPLLRQIGDDADRHQVQAVVQLALASGPGEERLDDLVGYSHAGKTAQRVVPIVKLRIYQGEGIGQHPGRSW